MLTVLLAFFIAFFLTSNITTSMTVSEEPSTIDSYADILSHENMMPLWMSVLNDHKAFRDAPAGSEARQIWDRAVRNGLNKSMLTIEPSFMVTVISAMETRTGVSLMNGFAIEMGQANACLISRQTGQWGNLMPWQSVDPKSPEHLKGYFASSFVSPALKLRLHQLLSRLFEMSTVEKELTRELGSFGVSQPVGYLFREVQQCLSNVKAVRTPVFLAAKTSYYNDLFVSIAASFAIALILLFSESLGRVCRG